MPKPEHYEVAIIGGGVIGLSLAWELSRRGRSVCVIERDQPGRAASWAGAGMIPPGPAREFWPAAEPYEQLAGLSGELHRKWHELLFDETGIDNGYRESGSIYLAEDENTTAALCERQGRWQQLGIEANSLSESQLANYEPVLAKAASSIEVPGESQIRNPRHLQALVHACKQDGVRFVLGTEASGFHEDDKRLMEVKAGDHRIVAEQFCVTAGCWSGKLTGKLGIKLPIQPLRGQIALLKGAPGILKRIVNVGSRYLVPREDGRILVGSTVEEVGFNARTTNEGIAGLLEFVARIAPPLAELSIEKTWAGLRPATPDGLPYLGPCGDLENAWVATGHFRAGLQLSTGTARVMADAMCEKQPEISLAAFSLDRQSLRCEV
ncbi:glycine oxidase ThiO [Adhaeretor mobilis]|uniref:Hydrogen cyanide synthase subunit HcnC n=1 Tax=Adhaeretor mobilis TaxID=1930276 RepID=A0A517MXU4_9BACT|nr:glycine oxidase ThiO [Adhaeretor mobilis]QDS99702.1 Hydrogen cyanide synthase subunit HcnC precursor [Adhaeretor mobilis]